MIPLIPKKTFSSDKFQKYLHQAEETSQWSNWGWAVGALERRARDMFEIEDTKAIIATSSGTSAIHAIVHALRRREENDLRVATQDFTFATNSLGPCQGPIVFDMDTNLQLDLSDSLTQEHAKIIIATNCFGHLLDLDAVIEETENKGKILVLDNATVPYTFYKGRNSLNYGTASMLSLHATKLVGFGEGGLVVIDKEYEEDVRRACNYGKVGEKFNERSGNYKMSELSAAGILQYWDQFDFKELRKRVVDNYFDIRYKLRDRDGAFWPNWGDDNDDKFFPAWVPFLYDNPEESKHDELDGISCKKYYMPLRGYPVSTAIYERIMCYSLAKDFDKCLNK